MTVPVTDTAYGQIALDPESVTAVSMVGKNTEEIVRSYFSDIPVMIQIARCESAFRQNLPDGTVLKGRVDPRDTGVMQINLRYHEATATGMGINLHTLDGNLSYARDLYNRQGTQPWNASAPCWAPTIAMR